MKKIYACVTAILKDFGPAIGPVLAFIFAILTINYSEWLKEEATREKANVLVSEICKMIAAQEYPDISPFNKINKVNVNDYRSVIKYMTLDTFVEYIGTRLERSISLVTNYANDDKQIHFFKIKKLINAIQILIGRANGKGGPNNADLTRMKNGWHMTLTTCKEPDAIMNFSDEPTKFIPPKPVNP